MRWASCLLCIVLACGDDDEPAVDAAFDTSDTAADGETDAGFVEQPGCDMLVPEHCAFPFPSMRFMQEDTSTATGFRVAMTREALPPSLQSEDIALTEINRADGWSRVIPFSTVFPDEDLDDTNLPGPRNLEASLEPDSPVQLIDLDTGERIPVWGDIERRGAGPAQRALVLRPMLGIPYGHRVAAVVTDSLRYASGATPVPPEGFRRIRDDEPTGIETLENRRASFETLFETLDGLGVARERVLLAWRTVINSRESAQGALPNMIRIAADAFAESAPSFSITRCVAADEADHTAFGCTADDEGSTLNPLTWRRIYATVEMPSFLGDDERIAFDSEGLPTIQGTFTADLVINVPASVRDSGEPAPIVTFGHGLLATPDTYLTDDRGNHGQMVLADRLGAIFIGTRWSGLATDDLGRAGGVISDFDTMPALGDRLAQGVVNTVLISPMVTQVMRDEPLLSRGASSLVDPDRVAYTGISQGGIIGTTYLALTPFVRTGVLHVPSAGYANLLPHSPEFTPFKALLDLSVRNKNDQQILFTLAQRFFEHGGDPINYMEHIVDEPLTELGAKNALWQCAEGDLKAPWFGCDAMIRTGGFAQTDPTVREIFGVPAVSLPSAPGTSMLQYYDPGLEIIELSTENTESNNAHQAIRRNSEVHAQIEAYFSFEDPSAEGTVINPCDGACNVTPVPVPGE